MESVSAPEKTKEIGVISPEKPVEYLKDLFNKTPNFLYTAADIPSEEERVAKQAEVQKHRERLEAALPHLPEIGRDYANLLRAFCDKLQLNPGKIKVYLVGGRVYGKSLVETSDFDLVLTVENPSQGLQATPADSSTVASAKRAQYKDWSKGSLDIGRKYKLNDDVDGRESSLLEPKGLGLQTDKEFTAANADTHERKAVLIYSE